MRFRDDALWPVKLFLSFKITEVLQHAKLNIPLHTKRMSVTVFRNTNIAKEKVNINGWNEGRNELIQVDENHGSLFI